MYPEKINFRLLAVAENRGWKKLRMLGTVSTVSQKVEQILQRFPWLLVCLQMLLILLMGFYLRRSCWL
jgi:preprotein translocase subunit SecG